MCLFLMFIKMESYNNVFFCVGLLSLSMFSKFTYPMIFSVYFQGLMKIQTVCREAPASVASISRRSLFGWWHGEFKDLHLGWGYGWEYWTHPHHTQVMHPNSQTTFVLFSAKTVLNENHPALLLETNFCQWSGIGWGLGSEPARQQDMGVYSYPISVHPNTFI